MGITFRRDHPNSPIKDLLHPVSSGLTCSFCGVPGTLQTLTEGTGLRGRFKDTVRGETFETVKTHVQTIVRACSQCVLKITPTVDKHGDIIRSNMRFPESEG